MGSADDRAASELNRELTSLLTEAGTRYGFDVAVEYAVKGGRLDVVWTWTPPFPLPGLERPVPVVGFEIESSWRTRKHVKGDLLNLHDAGVGLGVIALAGTERRTMGCAASRNCSWTGRARPCWCGPPQTSGHWLRDETWPP